MRERVREQFTATMDKSFDRLEKYLETNLMCVPKHVLLPEDAAHALSDPSEDDERAVDEEIEQLTSRIFLTKYANSRLRDELKEMEEAQRQSNEILNRFSAIDQIMKDNSVSDLRESVRFNLTKAHKCVEIVGRVKELAAQAKSQCPDSYLTIPLDKSEVDTVLHLGKNPP